MWIINIIVKIDDVKLCYFIMANVYVSWIFISTNVCIIADIVIIS